MNFSYYTQVNTDLLRHIPADAALVVETGCGAGALGAAYKQINPLGRYVGLELFPEAAAAASARLDQVVQGNVEEICLKEVLGEGQPVDCLVYGDVLDHLQNPWSLLTQHVDCLKPDGQVVACIPNAQHWSLLLQLLHGKWDYQEAGLLDKTHLRFFTLDSIQKLFAQAGLLVHEVLPRGRYDAPGYVKTQQLLSPVIKELGLNEETFAKQSGALQYVVRAVKAPIQKRLFIQGMLGETKVCSRVRVEEPTQFCKTIPGVRADFRGNKADLSLGRPEERKVFIWQRTWPESMQQQQQLLRRGYLTIAEIDDDPQRWKEYHESNDYFAFRSCHAVQVSTEPLAEYIRQFNPNVAVFPNQIAYLPPLKAFLPQEQVTLFFGALNREEDWQSILPPLNRLLQQYKGKLTVQVIHDRKFFDSLHTEEKTFIPFCPYSEYIQRLQGADIALLPLLDNRFNRMKSDLKFLECAAHGVAALASPTVYEKVVEEGRTGLIYRSEQEFENKLAWYIEETEGREQMIRQAYQWVRDHRLLSAHYRKRYQWYMTLLDAWPELTRQLEERVYSVRGS